MEFRGKTRPESRFGRYARWLWILEVAIMLVSFGPMFAVTVRESEDIPPYSSQEVYVLTEAVIPGLSGAASVIIFLARYRPGPLKRIFPPLHPAITLVLSLLFMHAVGTQGFLYWLLWLWNAGKEVVIVQTVFALVLFWLWLTYAFISVAAIAVYRTHRKRSAVELTTQDPVELTTQDASNVPDLEGSTQQTASPISQEYAAPARIPKPPAFERVGSQPDGDLEFI